MNDIINAPVPTTPKEANDWIQSLVDNNLEWHFEDDPSEVINGKTGQPLFSGELECADARLRVAACFALLDDPFDNLIHAQHVRDNEPDVECGFCNATS